MRAKEWDEIENKNAMSALELMSAFVQEDSFSTESTVNTINIGIVKETEQNKPARLYARELCERESVS